MEEKKPARRKPRRAKAEDYYKVLGVAANASQTVIKQKYIESVKAFPPETHPEQFQQIRRAYETLRNPAKRSEYDIQRKYGNKIEKLMEQAAKYMEKGQWSKAEELCRQAVKISPENPGVHLGLAGILLKQGDQDGFEEQFAAAFDVAPEDAKPLVLVLQARLLSEQEMTEDALRVLERAMERYPELPASHSAIYLEVYIDMGMEKEALNLAESLLPAPDSRDPEDIFSLIGYVNVIMDLERKERFSAIQTRIRKFIKSFADKEDRLMIQAALFAEHDTLFNLGLFRRAEMYIDLAYYAEPNNPHVREQRRQTQELMRIEKELHRAARDEDLFPLVHLTATKWFYEECLLAEALEGFLDGALSEVLQELEIMDEDYAAGIAYLKRRYPLLYRRFQAKWEELFKEKTALLNREARRRLK